MTKIRSRSRGRAVAQVALGAAMLAAGTGHLTFQREEFQAQVPPWFPADPDLVVLLSGVVEIGFGAALLTVWRQPWRGRLGLLLALFFVAVSPATSPSSPSSATRSGSTRTPSAVCGCSSSRCSCCGRGCPPGRGQALWSTDAAGRRDVPSAA